MDSRIVFAWCSIWQLVVNCWWGFQSANIQGIIRNSVISAVKKVGTKKKKVHSSGREKKKSVILACFSYVQVLKPNKTPDILPWPGYLFKSSIYAVPSKRHPQVCFPSTRSGMKILVCCLWGPIPAFSNNWECRGRAHEHERQNKGLHFPWITKLSSMRVPLCPENIGFSIASWYAITFNLIFSHSTSHPWVSKLFRKKIGIMVWSGTDLTADWQLVPKLPDFE